jgi:hypothetical protein
LLTNKTNVRQLSQKIAAISIAAIVLVSCKHNAPDFVVTPANTSNPTSNAPSACDTTNVSYRKDVQPIIRNNCYECHSASVTQEGGLNLEDTASLKQYLTRQYRGNGIYGSQLMHIINQLPGSLQMPPTYKLDSCSINKIQRWIHLGAPIS